MLSTRPQVPSKKQLLIARAKEQFAALRRGVATPTTMTSQQRLLRLVVDCGEELLSDKAHLDQNTLYFRDDKRAPLAEVSGAEYAISIDQSGDVSLRFLSDDTRVIGGYAVNGDYEISQFVSGKHYRTLSAAAPTTIDPEVTSAAVLSGDAVVSASTVSGLQHSAGGLAESSITLPTPNSQTPTDIAPPEALAASGVPVTVLPNPFRRPEASAPFVVLPNLLYKAPGASATSPLILAAAPAHHDLRYDSASDSGSTDSDEEEYASPALGTLPPPPPAINPFTPSLKGHEIAAPHTARILLLVYCQELKQLDLQ